MAAMQVPEHDSERCRVIRGTFDRLGDKWSLLVISILSEGPQRFTVLKFAAEGISQRMLTLTLRKLERDGLVERTVFAQVPPRVEYALSPLGRTLIGPVMGLAEWAVAHDETLQESRRAYDSRSLVPA
jgi:DNA-binding HxlR family transcriptional regulator